MIGDAIREALLRLVPGWVWRLQSYWRLGLAGAGIFLVLGTLAWTKTLLGWPGVVALLVTVAILAAYLAGRRGITITPHENVDADSPDAVPSPRKPPVSIADHIKAYLSRPRKKPKSLFGDRPIFPRNRKQP